MTLPLLKDDMQISKDLEKSKKVAMSLLNISFSLKQPKIVRKKQKNSRWEAIEELISSI